MARAMSLRGRRCFRILCLLVLLSLWRLPSAAHGGSLGVAVEKDAPDDVQVTVSVLVQSHKVFLDTNITHATHTWARHVKPQDKIQVHVQEASSPSNEGSTVDAHLSPSRRWTVAFPSSNITISLNLNYTAYNPCLNASLALCTGQCIFSGKDNNYTCGPASSASSSAISSSSSSNAPTDAAAVTTPLMNTVEPSTVPFEYERTVEEGPRLETQTIVIVGFVSILLGVPMVAVFLLLRSRKLDADSARRRRRNTSGSRSSGDSGFRQRRNAVSGRVELTPPPTQRKPARTRARTGGILTPLMPNRSRGPVSEDGRSNASHHRSPLASETEGPHTSTGQRGHGGGGDGRRRTQGEGSVSGVGEALFLMDESPSSSPTSTNVDFDVVNSPPPRHIPDTAVHSSSGASESGFGGQRHGDTTRGDERSRDMNARSPRIVADEEEAQGEWDSEEEASHAAIISSSSLLSPVPALASRRRILLSASSNSSPTHAAPALSLRPPSPGDQRHHGSGRSGDDNNRGGDSSSNEGSAKQDTPAIVDLRSALSASLRGSRKANAGNGGDGKVGAGAGAGAAGGGSDEWPLRHNSCASTSSPPPIRTKSAARAARDRVLARLREKAAQQAASGGTAPNGVRGSNTRNTRYGNGGSSNGGAGGAGNKQSSAVQSQHQQQHRQRGSPVAGGGTSDSLPGGPPSSRSGGPLQRAAGNVRGNGSTPTGDKLIPRIGLHRSPQKKSRHGEQRATSTAAAADVAEAAPGRAVRASSASTSSSSPLSSGSRVAPSQRSRAYVGGRGRANGRSPGTTTAGSAGAGARHGGAHGSGFENESKERGANGKAAPRTRATAAETANKSEADMAPQESGESQKIQDWLSESTPVMSERIRAASDPVSPRRKPQQRREQARSRARGTRGSDLQQRLLQDSLSGSWKDTDGSDDAHQRMQSPVGTVFRCKDAGVRLVIEEPSEAVLRTSSMLSDYRRATMDKKAPLETRQPQGEDSAGSGSEIDL